MWIFSILFNVYGNTAREKIEAITVSSITREILVCDMESCYKKIFVYNTFVFVFVSVYKEKEKKEIRNVRFTFWNFQKKIEKICMNSEKSIKSFEIQKKS